MSADPSVAIAIRGHSCGDRPHLARFLEMAMVETYPDLRDLTRSELRERVEAEVAHYYSMADKLIWVAETGEEVVGCLWAMESFHPVTGLPDLFVVNVAVAPAHRGQGVARRLFACAVEAARSKGIRHVRLFVNPINQDAYRLYTGLGFEPQTHEMRLDVSSSQRR